MKFLRKRGVGGSNVKIKGKDGVHVRGKEKVKGVWKSNFERLMTHDRKRSNSVEHLCGSRWKVCEYTESK